MVTRAATFGRRGPVPAALPARAKTVTPTQTASAETQPGFFARLPWLTFALCVTLVFKFNTELRAAVDFSAPNSPGHFSLLALGASSRTQVLGAGEWWRLFTAPVLHLSASHLAGNLVALLVAGLLLEPLVGIGWFGAIYFVGGFCGALASMLLNAPGILTVGASGAIMSCVAALFALSFHEGVKKPWLMRRWSAMTLFPALSTSVSHGVVVDVNAHLGGAVAGVALAFALLVLWPENTPKIPGRRAAALVAGVFIALTAFSFATSWNSFGRYAAEAREFIPETQLRAIKGFDDAQTRDIVAKYPDDPRAHFERSGALIKQHDLDGAEAQLVQASELAATHPGLLPDAAARAMRTALALDMAAVRGKDEGRRVAAPLCADPQLEAKWLQRLTAASLCGAGSQQE